MKRPDQTRDDPLAQVLFVDRVGDSQAVRESLQQHLGRVRADRISAEQNPNVLTFYGLGGMGKSRLSQRLEQWLTGALGDATDWGPRPRVEVAAVRWDLEHGDGVLDPVQMLLALRAAMGRLGSRTRAFDLGLAAYLAGVRPGETVELLSHGGSSSVINALESLAADLGAASIVANLGTVAVKALVDASVVAYRRNRELRRFDSLGDLLRDCQAISPGHPSPDIVADLFWLLTEEFEAMPAADRPALVVFIDTFEKIQQPEAIKSEAQMNRLMLLLPYALFIVTGKEKLTWHETRDGLTRTGPKYWPSLVDERTEEPRQHLLGRLSPHDRDELIARRRRLRRWPISDAELAVAAERTDGYPLHIDAVCQIADNLTEDGVEELTADDLGRSLPDLVKRLLAGLSDEQARAFQAACLLPYFDTELVAAVAQISEGAVKQCIRRTLVEPHHSERYRYKVHDEIRSLVRRAGADVQAGWTEGDWRQAAERGLAEARRRHQVAWDTQDDRGTIEAIVLGITIAAAHGLHAEWLADAVRTAPTIRGLASYLPPVDTTGALDSDAAALIRLIRALDAPKNPDSVLALREIFDGPTQVAEQGGRWLAYRLRELHRREEALQVFAELLERHPERSRLYRNQYSVTLRGLRRFQDGVSYRTEHGLTPAVTAKARQAHGHPPNLDEELADAGRQSSRRFGFELETTAWSVEARFRPVPSAVVDAFAERAIVLGAPAREADAWVIRGYAALHDEAAFEECLGQLVRIGRRESSFSRASVARLLGLRALASGSERFADRAWQEATGMLFWRPTAWIFTEFVLELVDRPMPVVPTQWLEPLDVVRQRWHSVARNIVARAASGDVLVG